MTEHRELVARIKQDLIDELIEKHGHAYKTWLDELPAKRMGAFNLAYRDAVKSLESDLYDELYND